MSKGYAFASTDKGFAPGSEFLWAFHYSSYWDLTQRIYREELDLQGDGALDAGVPFCASGTPSCDADDDYASRPQAVKDPVKSVSLTGKIRRPMITVHGTLGAWPPIATDSDVYDKLVDSAGSGSLHRYHHVEDGTHTDGLYPPTRTSCGPCCPVPAARSTR